MSVTLHFSQQGQSVEVSEKDLHDLQNAVTFALNGGTSIASKKFGAIRVVTQGINTAFSAGNSQQPVIIQTDC